MKMAEFDEVIAKVPISMAVPTDKAHPEKNHYTFGLTLHYSCTEEMWKAGYGINKTKIWLGTGKTPSEALSNLVKSNGQSKN